MTTLMNVSMWIMICIMFLQNVPALVSAAKGAWTAVSGLFQKKS